MPGRFRKSKGVVIREQIRNMFNAGHSPDEIAERLNVDKRTVQGYLQKLEAENITDLPSEDISSELHQLRTRLAEEMSKTTPSHLLIQALSSRQMELLRYLSELEGIQNTRMYEPSISLSDDAIQCIADVILADRNQQSLDLSKQHWHKMRN